MAGCTFGDPKPLSMKILFACDQKWRDLPSLVVIRHHLQLRGHRVFILPTKNFEALLPLIQPDCVVLNAFWDRRYCRLAEQLRAAGIAVAVLPTEGATPTHLWGPMVFGEFSDFSLIDYLMCWNHTTAEGIVEHGTMAREKIDVVGCPRMDFAVPPLVNSCRTRADVCAMLGLDPARPIVTWASRFALAHIENASAERKAAFYATLSEIGYTQCVERLGYKVEEHVLIYAVALQKFVEAFIAVSRARPELQFVFKPHPNDNVATIREQLSNGGLADPKIAVGVYIGDTLRATDVLVNSDCNTSIEAWIHGVPVVEAQLHHDYIASRPDIAAGNWKAETSDAVITLIDRALEFPSVSPEMKRVRADFIARWFGELDGRRGEQVAISLNRFLAARGGRRKFYPFAPAGGMKNAVKSGVTWMRGKRVRNPFRRGSQTARAAGVYDKVISRKDVIEMGERLKPYLVH